MSHDIYMCQACDGVVCQTNSDDPVCHEGRPIARWTKIAWTTKQEGEVLVIGLEDALRIVSERLMRKEEFLRLGDYERKKLLGELKKHSFLARPVGILLTESTD